MSKRSRTASTTNEYPLVNFHIFRSLARKYKNACWDIPNPYEERRRKMPNRKRNIQMKFYVNEDEKALIEKKMELLPTQRYGAYLRKMAIDGYVIYTDTENIKSFNKELQKIGRNINQIAKRLNANDLVYEADIAEIKERLDQIWHTQRHILSSLH